MQNLKSPDKKPIYIYIIGVIIAMFVINSVILPALMRRNIKDVDYSTFLNMVESGQVGKVQLEDDYITFTDKTGTESGAAESGASGTEPDALLSDIGPTTTGI